MYFIWTVKNGQDWLGKPLSIGTVIPVQNAGGVDLDNGYKERKIVPISEILGKSTQQHFAIVSI
jgi:hypothetical protein